MLCSCPLDDAYRVQQWSELNMSLQVSCQLKECTNSWSCLCWRCLSLSDEPRHHLLLLFPTLVSAMSAEAGKHSATETLSENKPCANDEYSICSPTRQPCDLSRLYLGPSNKRAGNNRQNSVNGGTLSGYPN